MYPVSADFHNLSIADAPTSRVRIYFIEANVDCTDDNDVQSNGTLLCMPGETDSNGRIEKGGVTINEFFNSDANVQIGATVSSQIGMTLINRDGALDGFNYGRCKLYIDVYDDTNSTWLTCPMGVYNIAIPKRRKVQLVSATGYDQMQQLDEIADSWWNGLDWGNGIALLQIIQSMAATLGIHLSANTSANIVNSGLSYTEIPFTSIEMTYRDILSYIAETTGTIARFDRNGALDLRWFSDAVLSTDTQTYAGGLVTFTATNRASISSLSAPFSPIQDLHGYDSPWPGGGGVNILDPNLKFTAGTYYGGAVLSTSDGYNITLSGTPTESGNIATNNIPTADAIVLPAGTYTSVGAIFSTYKADGSWYTNRQVGTWTAEEPFIIRQAYIQAVAGTTISGSRFIALAKGSTAPTSWTPYSNICPISGRTGLSVWDDTKYGGTIEWNQRQNTYTRYELSGGSLGNVSVAVDSNGYLVVNGTPTEVVRIDPQPAWHNIAANHVSLIIADGTGDIDWARVGGLTISDTSVGKMSKYNANFSDHIRITLRANQTYNNSKIRANCFDLTQMFGSTIADYIYGLEQANTGAGVAWFRNLFPKPYYSYNAGETTCVSAVNGDPYWKKDIDWTTQAGTVYGGTLDVVTGVLTVDRACVNLSTSWYWYIGGTQPTGKTVVSTTNFPSHVVGGEICSHYKRATTPYVVNLALGEFITAATSAYFCFKNESGGTAQEFKDIITAQETAGTPIQVCYELATPLTYQLTATQVAVLAGTNNVWSTGDSVSVTVAEPTLVEIQTDTVGNQCLSIDVGEYQVSQIDALSVKASQADVGVTIGSGGNAYTILDNPMLFGDEAAITTKATPIYNRLSAFRLFTPISMRCIMDWSIEAGDIITVTNESVTYDLPIFQQRLRWRGGYVVSDLFSNGEQERPTQSKEIRSSFRSNTQLHEFEVTLEQLRSYIQSVDGNYTLIQQTVDAITQTVANQNVTIQNILDPTGEIWTAITKNTSNLSSIEDSLNNEITERRSYIRFIPSEPAIVMGVDEDNEIKLKLVNNIIYFFNGADDSTDLSLAYAYFNSQEAFADRFVAGESVQIGTNDNAAHWLWKKLNNGDLVLELVG